MGQPSVRLLQQTIDARELAEWKCYYELEPFGQDRSDVGAAIVAHTVAACLGSGNSSMSVQDFMPRFGEARPRQTGEQMLLKARAYAARARAMGAYRGS